MATGEPVMFVDQSGVYGRMQKTDNSKKPLWLLAPIALVAAGGILFMTTQNTPARDTLATTTTTQVATNDIRPAMPTPAPLVAPTAPIAGDQLAALDRRPPAALNAPIRRSAPTRSAVPAIPAPENESPATGVTANVNAPVAPTIEAPAVALAPPPEVTPGPDSTATAQVTPAVPDVGPLAAIPAPQADAVQQ